MSPLRFAAAIATLLAVGCGEQVHPVRIVLPEGRAATGFVCTEDGTPAGDPLFAALCHARQNARVAIVVDYLGLREAPLCWSDSIRQACSVTGCDLLQRDVVHVPLSDVRDELVCMCEGCRREDGQPIQPQSKEGVDLASRAILRAAPAPVTERAPGGQLLVRMVMTAEDVPAGGFSEQELLDSSQVLGCVRSCPVALEEVRSRVVLDYDFGFGGTCDREAVAACANFPLSEAPADGAGR